MDWVFDGADILYAIRAGYRGSNSFHNANRLAMKRVHNFRALAHRNGTCTDLWTEAYTFVGKGWCRPTDGFLQAGHGLQDSDCAQRCTESSVCHAFANNHAANGGCVLYPAPANFSGKKTLTVDCFTKAGGRPLKTEDGPAAPIDLHGLPYVPFGFYSDPPQQCLFDSEPGCGGRDPAKLPEEEVIHGFSMPPRETSRRAAPFASSPVV